MGGSKTGWDQSESIWKPICHVLHIIHTDQECKSSFSLFSDLTRLLYLKKNKRPKQRVFILMTRSRSNLIYLWYSSTLFKIWWKTDYSLVLDIWNWPPQNYGFILIFRPSTLISHFLTGLFSISFRLVTYNLVSSDTWSLSSALPPCLFYLAKMPYLFKSHPLTHFILS